MQKLRYRYRLYPHPHQKLALARVFGCARVVWNDALALSQDLYKRGQKYPGGAALQKQCITQAKWTPERSWLAEVSNVSLQQSLRDLDQAFRNWWRNKGKSRAPRFKKRNNRQSIRFQSNAFLVEGRKLRLTKVGSIPINWSRDLPATPSSVTIIKDCAGRYCASFVVEVERPKLPASSKTVGIDLGLASLAVTSEGEKIAPPKFLRSALQRIRRLQRSLSRKEKGSHNRQKARLRLARAHVQVADQRLDHLHKLSTRLIRENQTVVLEDLNVSGMVKNRKLARAIADAGWRLLRTLLESKAEIYGREVKIISRWEPTSQTCSACGHRDGKKSLSVRAWRCSACGAEHDRDVNAARNILAAGLAARLNACGAEGKTSVLASGSEVGTHLNQGVQPCTT
ncbi:MAG: IS200/IS605 family element transposase accessory protein TnpB [Synechococcus sp. SB0662_bin_45]|nr:IS200/IS605 family element transposase accessory protein TnpB [Synechococcus sp. SB0668_bin_13]MYE21986.1 IS200/IS605 family element transposase accessory protein TnpB [Synechococcus sp. SB0662_bin_45]